MLFSWKICKLKTCTPKLFQVKIVLNTASKMNGLEIDHLIHRIIWKQWTSQLSVISAPNQRLNIAFSFIHTFLIFCLIRLLSNKLHSLSPFGGHHSLLFDQGFQKMAGWDWSERHLKVIGTPSDNIVPSYVVYACQLEIGLQFEKTNSVKCSTLAEPWR